MYFLLLVFFSSILFSQTIVTVQLDTFSRPMPLIGFNTNAHHTLSSWKIPAFRDSTVVLRPSILRYPGGTTANYWDWKSGWFQNAPTTPPEYANINPNTIRAEEFKLGTNAATSEALFVTNFQYSTLAYELQGLQHAESLGFAMKYIELGNEHNLASTSQFITPSVYARGAKMWTDTLKKYFPLSKICLVGGAPPATPAWHDSIFAQNPKIDALAFHVYLGAGNTDSLLNTKRALSIPFAQLNQRFIQSKFPTIPQNVEVWVTEFNLGEDLAGNPQQHAETWTHGLYVAAMLHIFLENPKITMIVNHNLTNHMEFAAISPFDFHITANGVIMQLFGEMSKGMTNATRLQFPSLPMQQYGTTTFPKLIGWKFSDGKENRGVIVNLSSDTISCNLQTVFGSSASVTQFSSDSIKKISGKQSLTLMKSSTASTVKINPYAVLQLMPQQITSAAHSANKPASFILEQNFPNPFNPTTQIRFRVNNDNVVTLKVYTILGQEIKTLLDDKVVSGEYSVIFNASTLPSGIYLYRLQSGRFTETKRMAVLK